MAFSSRKVIIVALLANCLIAITKFVAAFITGSSAMLTEGIHSLVDTGNQFLLLYGIKRAQKPPDDEFPFGYGKEIYFWSFVVAILIFSVGSGVSLYEGYHHIIHPSPMVNLTVNYVVLALAAVFEGYSWLLARKAFSRFKGKLSIVEAFGRAKDPTLFMVYFEDSVALAGLFAAFLGISLVHLTGNHVFDGMASVVIGLMLGATAIFLALETKNLLIGESADPEIVKSIREIASAIEEIENVNEILTLHMGPDFILVNISVDFVDSVPSGKVEKLLAELDSRIKEQHPMVKKVFIEPESRVSL